MALQARYKQFLTAPKVEALAPNASIHYIPTLCTINEPAAIMKHLFAQDQQLKKQDEKFIHVVEGDHKLCVETETILEFLYGGGTYLPGMDDNFLTDRKVTLPIIHVVAFDKDDKIQQIRLFWDQGGLLKSLDVIGSRGRSWPIQDVKEQSRLVSSSIAAAPAPGSRPSTAGSDRVGRRQSRGGANGDPYTSLSLFAPREPAREESPGNAVAPRESAKPAPRDWNELFAGDYGMPPSRSTSPSKESNITLKAGAGTHHPINRLFVEEPADNASCPEKEAGIKTNPHKYDHFDFGEKAFAPKVPASKVNKFASQWNFADFTTPAKASKAARDRNQRHFSWEDDVDEITTPMTNIPHGSLARPDAVTHFDFNDTTPKADRTDPVKSRVQNRGHGLYEDHINIVENGGDSLSGSQKAAFGEDHIKSATNGSSRPSEKTPFGDITNMNQHRKTFDSHFEIKDDLSAPKSQVGDENANSKNVTDARKKVIETMQPSWDMFAQSPQDVHTGIKISGNGHGGRKEESNWWDFQ